MAGEFDIQVNLREQFCNGRGNCPLIKAKEEIDKGQTIEGIQRICRTRSLRDDTLIVAQGIPSDTSQDWYVAACTKRLPEEANYDSCGSMFIKRKETRTATATTPYTPEPIRGERPTASSSRLFTWLLFQLPPDRFQQFLKLPNPVPVVAGTESWEKAIIKLKDEEKELLVGLTLYHPGMTWEDIYWNRLMFSPRIAEGDLDLEMGITNSGETDKFLTVTLQNIYQDNNTETIFDVQSPAQTSATGIFELPNLVQDVPSVLMRIEEISEQQWKENSQTVEETNN